MNSGRWSMRGKWLAKTFDGAPVKQGTRLDDEHNKFSEEYGLLVIVTEYLLLDPASQPPSLPASQPPNLPTSQPSYLQTSRPPQAARAVLMQPLYYSVLRTEYVVAIEVK
jgi:hypothetical protein